MAIKLFDSELKVMDILWRKGDQTAKQIADLLREETGWNVNTTYTVIKKCVAKGAIQRTEPNFLCHPLLPKTEVQKAETDELIGKLFDGSADKLFSALLGRKKLTAEQLTALKEIVGDLDEVEP
ncbi:MAG: BlaI/MecI/CopY family transcriptional regulator [Oscillospiraceae bacterium]|jgi:BlaI family penicillinase repressor|nr:BlaI/MecI/CopY family transcriptional regulator [Oscillospiraceae bacterium]